MATRRESEAIATRRETMEMRDATRGDGDAARGEAMTTRRKARQW